MVSVGKVKTKKSKLKFSSQKADLLHTSDSEKKIPKSQCSVVIFKPHVNHLASMLTRYLNQIGIMTGKRHEMYKKKMQTRIQNHQRKGKKTSLGYIKATTIEKGSTEIVPLTDHKMQQFLSPQMSNSVMLWRPRTPDPMNLRIPSVSKSSLISSRSYSRGKVASVSSLSHTPWKPSVQSFSSLRGQEGHAGMKRNSRLSQEKVITKYSFGSIKSKSSKISNYSTGRKSRRIKKTKSNVPLDRNELKALIEKQAREVIEIYLERCTEIREAEMNTISDPHLPVEEKNKSEMQQRREHRMNEKQGRMDVMDPVQEVDEDYHAEENDRNFTCCLGRELTDSQFLLGEEDGTNSSRLPSYTSWKTNQIRQEEEEEEARRHHKSRSRERRIRYPGAKAKSQVEGVLRTPESMPVLDEKQTSHDTATENAGPRSNVQSSPGSKHIRESKYSENVTADKRLKRIKNLEKINHTLLETKQENVYQKNSKQRKMKSEFKGKFIPNAVEDDTSQKHKMQKYGQFGEREVTSTSGKPSETMYALSEPMIVEEQSIGKEQSPEKYSAKKVLEKLLQDRSAKNSGDTEEERHVIKVNVHLRQNMESSLLSKKSSKTRKTNDMVPSANLKSTSFSLDNMDLPPEENKDVESSLIAPDTQVGDTISSKRLIMPSLLSKEIISLIKSECVS